MIEIVFLLLVILSAFNYYLKRDIAYPPFIFSIIWCLVLLFYNIFSITDYLPIYEISEFTLVVFLTGVLVFSLGGIFPLLFNDSQKSSEYIIKSVSINHIFENILFYGIIALTPIFIYKAFTISLDTGVNNFFLGLRYGLGRNSQDGYGFLKYIIPLAIFNAYLRFFIYSKDKNKTVYRIKFLISVTITIILLILTTGRSNIFLLIIFFTSLKMISHKINLKEILLVSFTIVIIFFIFAVVMGKGGSTDYDFKGNITQVTEMFFWYMLSGIKAFDIFLQNQIQLNYGSFTFRFFYALGFKLGISNTAPIELVQPFMFIPLPTNVYTIYYTYIQDFGILISFFFILIFSAVHTIFYYSAKRGNERDRFFYALLMYPLIISFFQDQYFSLLSTWLQYIILYMITFNLFIKINYEKSK